VFAIARKALTDLASTSLEERLGEVFTAVCGTMDSQAKVGLAQALKTMSAPALVRSAFDLPAEQRATIQNALNETFSAEIRLRFEIAPDLVSGIELTAGGQKVAWSISDYLASLERDVGELPERERQAQGQAEPKPEAKPSPSLRRRPSLSPSPTEAKAEPKPEAKAEPKPEPKPEAKAEPKPKPKPSPS